MIIETANLLKQSTIIVTTTSEPNQNKWTQVYLFNLTWLEVMALIDL